MKKFHQKYFYFILVILFLCIFFITIRASYAFLTTTAKGKQYVMYTGNLAVEYKKKTDTINLTDTYPMTNQQGLATTSHQFTVTNTGTVAAKYQVRLELDEKIKDQVPLNNIKMSFSKDNQDDSTPFLLSNLETILYYNNYSIGLLEFIVFCFFF